MESILVIIGGIYHTQFKFIFLKNQKLCVHILLHFQNVRKILNIVRKNLSLIA